MIYNTGNKENPEMVERTQKEAKAVALKVWKYIAKHKLLSKDDLPPKLYKLIEEDSCQCPLCSMFMYNGECYECPLYVVHVGFCFNGGQPYNNWELACKEHDYVKASEAAYALVEQLKAWKVEK